MVACRSRHGDGNPDAGGLTRRALLALVAGLGSAAFVPRPTVDATSEVDPAADALAFFDALALSPGGRLGYGDQARVRKWDGPVDVTLTGLEQPEFAARLADTLALVERWTGLRLKLGGTGGARQLTVDLKTHDAMMARNNPRGFVCSTMTRGWRGALYRGRVAVSEDYTDCLEHELMHALGFDAHWSGQGVARPIRSVLAQRHSPLRAPRYSRWDELAIRTLYHPRLHPGMSRSAARAEAREVLSRLI